MRENSSCAAALVIDFDACKITDEGDADMVFGE
jgi:hypothetical protein